MEFTKEELANEEWRDVVEYEGMYQVSSLGRVWSLTRKVNGYYGFITVRGRLLKPAKDKKGYYRVALSKNNTLTTFKVHRMVCSAFIPNPNEYPQVNHKNCIKTDNRVENLEWCNNSQNQIHAYANGSQKPHITYSKKVRLVNTQLNIDVCFDTVKEAAIFLGYKKAYGLKEGLKRQGGKSRANGFQMFYL